MVVQESSEHDFSSVFENATGQKRLVLRGQSAAQQPMLAQSLKGVAFTTVGAQYLCMHVVVVGTPGRSTTLNMGRCQVKTGGLVNDTTPGPSQEDAG